MEKTYKYTDIPIMNSVLSIIIALITAGGVGFGFYYNTNNRLDTHDLQLKGMQDNISTIQDAIHENNVRFAIQITNLEHITESVDKIENNQTEIIKLLKK